MPELTSDTRYPSKGGSLLLANLKNWLKWRHGACEPVHASMLIRRPPGEVFSAFVNPQTLRKFWLSDASGPLARGRASSGVHGARRHGRVLVTRFESPQHLAFDWDGGIHVDMTFEPFGDGATRASSRSVVSTGRRPWQQAPARSKASPSCCAI